jgi:hypothetical protein
VTLEKLEKMQQEANQRAKDMEQERQAENQVRNKSREQEDRDCKPIYTLSLNF